MLAKDIDAISKLADIKGARARYQIAIVEGTDGSMSIRGGNSNVREHIEEVFATADPESRIAIAYSDSFPGAGGGAWASVARGFCSENRKRPGHSKRCPGRRTLAHPLSERDVASSPDRDTAPHLVRYGRRP